jgi:hypothetical protein
LRSAPLTKCWTVTENATHGLDQRLRIERLGEVVGSASVQTTLPISVIDADGGLQDHGDVPRRRIGLQALEDFVAVHVLQDEIKDDGIDGETCQPEGIAAGGTD